MGDDDFAFFNVFFIVEELEMLIIHRKTKQSE